MYSVYIRVCIYSYLSRYIYKHIYAYMLVITSNNIGHTSHLSQVLCESKPTDAPYANAIGWHTHTQTKHNTPLPKYRHAAQLPTITQTRKHAYAHARTCMRVQCNKIFTCTHVCNPCPCACPRSGTRKQTHTHLNLNTFKTTLVCMYVCGNALFLPQVVTLGCNWCPRPLGQHCLVGRSLGAMCTHKGCQCKRLWQKSHETFDSAKPWP